MTREMDPQDVAEWREHRDWWRKPDPFDPRNTPSPDDDKEDE